MKLQTILRKIGDLVFTMKEGQIVSTDGIKLSVTAEVNGLFAGQILLSLVYQDRVIYRYGAVDFSENDQIARFYKDVKMRARDYSEALFDEKKSVTLCMLGIEKCS